MAKILIMGCGSVGGLLAQKLADKGHSVIAVRRTPPAQKPARWVYHCADITDAQQLQPLPTQVDAVFFMVSADGRNEAAYAHVYRQGLGNVLRQFGRTPCFFISSTSVYGQDTGAWVDEDSPTEPLAITSQLIVHAERQVWAANSDNVVVRFSGIYGPGREYLLNSTRQSPTIQQVPPYFTNRIHQQDCVGVLDFLLQKKLAAQFLSTCYLASDDCPAPQWEVVSWLAQQMGCPGPLASVSSDRVGQNKRCSNRRLKELGYRFVFPDYQSGYRELLRHGKKN